MPSGAQRDKRAPCHDLCRESESPETRVLPEQMCADVGEKTVVRVSVRSSLEMSKPGRARAGSFCPSCCLFLCLFSCLHQGGRNYEPLVRMCAGE